jgi:hypothetical protein
MSAATTTAEVETLVAEVRVLMVGNRQITLSVAKQLDRVSLKDVIAFGRIRPEKGDHLVIGRHLDDGSLVTALWLPLRDCMVFSADLTGPIVLCTQHLVPLDAYEMPVGVEVLWRERLIYLVARDDNIRWCEHTHQDEESCATAVDFADQDEAIAVAVERIDKWNEPHLAASQLPLIVLAGLR